MLIVIDGSDSSGKNTQARLLVKRLEKEGKKVKFLDFPQYDSFFGKLVKDYLNGEFGSIEQINPKLVSLLYALDRYGAREKLLNWIEQGYIVVLDRYVESNMAYQAAKVESKKEFIEWIKKLEYGELELPQADMVFYLYVPLEFSQKLIKTRRDKKYLEGKKKDMHESNLDYLKKVEKMYLQLAKENNWEKIDCVEDDKLLSKEEIAQKIWKKVIPSST